MRIECVRAQSQYVCRASGRVRHCSSGRDMAELCRARSAAPAAVRGAQFIVDPSTMSRCTGCSAAQGVVDLACGHRVCITCMLLTAPACPVWSCGESRPVVSATVSPIPRERCTRNACPVTRAQMATYADCPHSPLSQIAAQHDVIPLHDMFAGITGDPMPVLSSIAHTCTPTQEVELRAWCQRNGVVMLDGWTHAVSVPLSVRVLWLVRDTLLLVRDAVGDMRLVTASANVILTMQTIRYRQHEIATTRGMSNAIVLGGTADVVHAEIHRGNDDIRDRRNSLCDTLQAIDAYSEYPMTLANIGMTRVTPIRHNPAAGHAVVGDCLHVQNAPFCFGAVSGTEPVLACGLCGAHCATTDEMCMGHIMTEHRERLEACVHDARRDYVARTAAWLQPAGASVTIRRTLAPVTPIPDAVYVACWRATLDVRPLAAKHERMTAFVALYDNCLRKAVRVAIGYTALVHVCGRAYLCVMPKFTGVAQPPITLPTQLVYRSNTLTAQLRDIEPATPQERVACMAAVNRLTVARPHWSDSRRVAGLRIAADDPQSIVILQPS